MTGNVLTRSVRSASYMALCPRDAANWVRDRVSGKTPLDQGLPWLAWPCIRFLAERLGSGSRVFEWGGGGSTLFFLDRGCHVTTVESSRDWSDKIRQQILPRTGACSRFDLRTIEAGRDSPESIEAYVEAVLRGRPWDLILIDGLEEDYLSRLRCVELAPTALRHGGTIVLDDAWRPGYDGVPGMLSSFTRKSFRGLGPARLGVTQTDVYLS